MVVSLQCFSESIKRYRRISDKGISLTYGWNYVESSGMGLALDYTRLNNTRNPMVHFWRAGMDVNFHEDFTMIGARYAIGSRRIWLPSISRFNVNVPYLFAQGKKVSRGLQV
ncbi:MAG: hypothetical protein COA58_05105 [Bacteroidetes bacterium]|nr:MAG: hypothetical protein COA58_05105 [Bacteroidota bacterium]